MLSKNELLNERKDEKYEFFKEDNYPIWSLQFTDTIGEFLFTFDKEIIFNFWTDYPNKLTKEQKEIFDKAFPLMSRLRGK